MDLSFNTKWFCVRADHEAAHTTFLRAERILNCRPGFEPKHKVRGFRSTLTLQKRNLPPDPSPMKKALLPLAAILLPALLSAQECANGRYSTYGYFPQIDSIPGVAFGSNTALGGVQQTLLMDIYAPANDTLSERPVVLVAYGGSFVTGSRGDVGPFCSELARMGYVAVAMDYRVGFFLPSESATMHAVMRCVHDIKGCIRYLRKTVAEDGNPYRIDPDRMIVGGVSAGAIGALQLTYMDQPSELPAPLVADSATTGGMEGTSGPLGYSSDVMACFSMSGALMDTSWVQPGDQPYCGIHETGDPTVPCYTAPVNAFGIPTGIIVSGDHDIQLRMKHVGVPNCYLEYNTAQHVGYLNYDPTYSVDVVVQFLARNVCTDSPGCPEVLNLVGSEQAGAQYGLRLYPTPANDSATLDLKHPGTVSILDIGGREVLRKDLPAGVTKLNVSMLREGLYIVQLTGAVITSAKLMIQR